MSTGSSMKTNSLPAKSGFCKNLTKKKSQQPFSIFSIVGTLNGLIWWNKKKFEYFHLTWDSQFLQAVALNFWQAVPTIHCILFSGIFCMSGTINLWCNFVACHSKVKKIFCVPSLAFMLYEQYRTSQIVYPSFKWKLPILLARSKCPCKIRLFGK
jgi:hypothetical protein